MRSLTVSRRPFTFVLVTAFCSGMSLPRYLKRKDNQNGSLSESIVELFSRSIKRYRVDLNYDAVPNGKIHA